ncbi:MAG: hypothetical protein RL748_2912, partial [Pseudomonadota bacterium]
MSYHIAVRELCEFAAKRGDLDLRFTPAPSAQQGIAGHKLVQGRRAAGYQREIKLSGCFGPLQISGRADGYDPQQNQLEEIKTHRGSLSQMPDNQRELHWAQCRIYGQLWLQQSATESEAESQSEPEPDSGSRSRADSLRLALVYFDIDSEHETVLFEHHNRATLSDYFTHLCQQFLQWAQHEMAHRQARDAALSQLTFPWPSFRPGQRDLAQAVYNAQRKACCLMAQAPTGIGKTIATLFPALKACPGQKLDKVLFLTAKNSGRQLALDALQSLPAHPLRVLELVARDQACEHPELACHGQSCPLAKGFYDRLPAARSAILSQTEDSSATSTLRLLDKAAVRELALQHQICPYYLSQELTRWSDVIVADYNYYFDISALLYALSRENQWRVSLLIDEAHNLLNRGRAMYSAELSLAGLRQARRLLPSALKKRFAPVARAWKNLTPVQADTTKVEKYQTLASPPQALLQALQNAASALSEHMLDQGLPLAPAVMQFFFDALHFCRVAELFDEHSMLDLSQQAQDQQLCLRNLIPAPFLRERFAACHAATLFSATLSPTEFYRDTLGLPANSHWVDIAAPFQASQLRIHLVPHISTRYHARQHTLPALVALMAAQYQQQPGNYLAFFSSFEYLEQAATRFALAHPDISMWQQSRSMNQLERQSFLQRFSSDGQGIGFAVLGGNFGEGIDLPGTRLIGAFIATLG